MSPHFLHFSPKMGKTVTIVLQSSVFYLKEEDAIFCWKELEFIVAKAIAFNYLAGTGILLSPNFNQDGRIDFGGKLTRLLLYLQLGCPKNTEH